MEKKENNKSILDYSFYMISLFMDARSKKLDDFDESDESMHLISDNKNETSEEKAKRYDRYIIINRRTISNLKLQKLMYFVEIYYLSKNEKEKELFNSSWSAWDYGPVNKELYNYFKKFGSLDITLSDEEIKRGNDICSEDKVYIDEVYKLVGSLSAFDLVTLTHLSTSPWYKIRNSNSNNYDFQKLNDSVIDKKESVKWFKDTFNFLYTNKKGNNKSNEKE